MPGLAAPLPATEAPASAAPAASAPASPPPSGGPRPPSPAPAARPAAAGRARSVIAGVTAWLRTTPGTIRALTAACIAVAVIVAVVIVVAFSGVAAGLSSIGGTDAPQVTAATGLYFSLSDMDAQVANVLLAGTDPALAGQRPQYLASYASDRQVAYADLQQAAVTAAGNPAAEGQLQSVLVNVAKYEALAADVLLTDQPATAGGPGGSTKAAGTTTAGTASGAQAEAVGYYRQATDLMRTSILPQVSSLATVSTAKLDGSYQSGHSDAINGLVITVASGVVLVAVLVAFQLFLSARFRRTVSPALAAATVLALALAVVTAGRLDAEASHLTVAKQDAFGSIVALSQARAVSYAANADESRYLADPGRAAQYQQSFLAESQQLAAVGNVSLAQYEPALAADFAAYQADNADVRFGGYLGAEFRNITFPGERAAAVAALRAYLSYEQADHQLRQLASTDPEAAASFDTSMAPGQSDWTFGQYDNALVAVIGINQRAFTAAIAAGRGGAAGWNGLVPGGCALLIIVLVLLAARPRLAEYR
jgi:hypothetical protein